jgi:hypothetical protein
MSVYMGFEGDTSAGMGLRIDILSKTGRILSEIQLYYQNNPFIIKNPNILSKPVFSRFGPPAASWIDTK